MNWKRFTTLIVSVICLAGIAKIVIACSDGPDTYDEQSFFLNTINKQPAFVPFYYTSYLTFYNEGYDFNAAVFDDNVPDENIARWEKYTGGEVSQADLDTFIYVFAGSSIANLYEHVAKGYDILVPQYVRDNGFTKWTLKHKDAEALLYLSFAKSCEPYTASLEAQWDDAAGSFVSPKRDSATMQQLVHEGLHQYEGAKNEDIKMRYAYQVLRMAFYSREYPQTLELFDRLFPAPAENFLYYRSLCLKAGALYKTGRKAEAAYLYSLAFDKSDDCKTKAYNSFRWAVNGKIDPLLPLCKNDHERAVLYIMQGLYDYEGTDERMVSNLKKAYEFDPKVRGLDIVMTRYINKLEESMLKDIATATTSRNSTVSALNSFAQMAATDGKCGTKAYWTLCSAYLYLIDGNIADCGKYLAKAASEKMTSNEQDVHSIITTLYIVRKDGRVTAATEQELLPMLKTVAARSSSEPRYKMLFSAMMVTVLKVAYMAQGDIVKAIYCHSRERSGDYEEDYLYDAGKMLDDMTPEKLNEVQAFVTKKDKTPFEQWLTENTNYTEGALLELEGTKYIRMYLFDKAVEVLSKVPANILNRYRLPDVQVSHILDGQDWNRSDSAVTYNKLDFARKMKELQDKLMKNPKDGRVAYQFANGLYNMSYYGKAHHAYDYYRSGSDEYAYFDYKSRAALSDFGKEYYNVKTPEKYYLQAFENSADRELKARCLFMAAKCWQKNCPARDDESYFDQDLNTYYNNTFKNPHLTRLKKEYRNTKFCTTAIGTCAFFRDYVSRK